MKPRDCGGASQGRRPASGAFVAFSRQLDALRRISNYPVTLSGLKRIEAKRDPDATRARILDAAVAEFAGKGLGGARVDEIAVRAGVNKRMLYHYFGNKDDLFLAALESAYADIRDAEQALDLELLAPVEAMRQLVEFTFDYFVLRPEFVTLLNSENLHRARHLQRSGRIRAMHSPLIDLIEGILKRGRTEGSMRGGVDPMQLYISIAGLGYFYNSNIHTLSTIFARDFDSGEERAVRRAHMVEVVLGYGVELGKGG
jgi:AcrR family transcriptional regulator